MNTIDADFTTLMNQGPMTAMHYFYAITKDLDERYGKGFALKNLDLVASLVATSQREACWSLGLKLMCERMEYLVENLPDCSKRKPTASHEDEKSVDVINPVR